MKLKNQCNISWRIGFSEPLVWYNWIGYREYVNREYVNMNHRNNHNITTINAFYSHENKIIGFEFDYKNKIFHL